jgi:hypothetical protein
MDDLSVLWVIAVLVALIGVGTSGCSSQNVRMSNAPIPSASDTNRFPAGTIGTDANDMSRSPMDIPSVNPDGTTGSLRSRR